MRYNDRSHMGARDNEHWLKDLRSTGLSRETALADLRAAIISGLPYALSKWLSPTDPQFEPLVEEIAQETLLRVLDRLDTFEGRSQFITWVQKIAVRLALTELRKRRWRDYSLEELVEEDAETRSLPALLLDPSLSPDVLAEQNDAFQRLRRIIAEELTERQRKAMIAVAIKGIPMEEVARRMGTNRNALYKLLHDARLNLKRRLENEGMDLESIFAVFAQK